MRPRPILALVLAATVACGGDKPPPVGPEGGTFVATFHTPNTGDGAVLVRIIGQVGSLTGLGAHRVASAVSGNSTRVVATGHLADGADLFEFQVDDVSKLASYVVVVDQVAASGTYSLIETSGYTVTLRRK